MTDEIRLTFAEAGPKSKIVKQEPQQQTTSKGTERTNFTPSHSQPPLLNQQDDRDKRFITPYKCTVFLLFDFKVNRLTD